MARDPLADLEQRIEKARGSSHEDEPEDAPTQAEGTGMALRMGLELVSGVAAGCLVGYGLDHLFGTFPFISIICFFLGAAGGFLTMLRTAGVATTGLFGKKK